MKKRVVTILMIICLLAGALSVSAAAGTLSNFRSNYYIPKSIYGCAVNTMVCRIH